MYYTTGSYTVNLEVKDNGDEFGENIFYDTDTAFVSIINNPPTTPSNPYPWDGATDMDVNTVLTWSCWDPDGHPLTYDVFFEADDTTPDVLVSSGQSYAFYDPPGMIDYDTRYYWMIVARDFYGAYTSGPVWDFITGSMPNDPPYPPENPNPENGSTDVALEIILNLTCSDPEDNDLLYNVYFEADDPEPDVLVSDNQTENTYNPGMLFPGVTYYWQIIARDEHEASTPGPVWHFTTVPNMPPNVPVITGPTSGKINNSYTYTTFYFLPNI